MGVVPNTAVLQGLLQHISRGPTGRCDYCSEQLNIGICRTVYWEMPGVTIWLHGECAKRLGVNLIQDSLRADQASS